MDRALNIAGGLIAAGAVLVFWAIVVVIIPAFIAGILFAILGELVAAWVCDRTNHLDYFLIIQGGTPCAV